jgi:hypothetical protein
MFPWQKLAIRHAQKELSAEVELSYKNALKNLDEVYSLELPLQVEYSYIAKTLNWGLILLVLV